MSQLATIKVGKSKIIYQDPSNHHNVIIKVKNVMQAADGRYAEMSGKGELIMQMTRNCFGLLEKKGIKTHFIEQIDKHSFRAKKLDMLPFECVARRIAFGSYLKRYPDVQQGFIFPSIITELFYKDDSLNDPYIVFNQQTNELELNDQTALLGKGFIKNLEKDKLHIPKSKTLSQVIEDVYGLTQKVFNVLEEAWSTVGATLVDLKIECGFDENDQLIVGDSIDADGWRVWLKGDKNQAIDRQNLYYLKQFSSTDIIDTLKRYQTAVSLTERFIK